MGLINIGFGNLVNADKMIAVVSIDAAPVKRLVQSARENGHCIDATQGRKTRSVLVMEDGRVVLSALVPDTISRRFSSSDLQVSDTQAGKTDPGPESE